MDDKKTRGENLRNYIKNKALSQKEAAEKIGISTPHLSNLLSGKDSMGYIVVKKICAAFPELSPTYLLNGEGPLVGGGNIQHLQHVTNSGSIVNVGGDEALRAQVADLQARLEKSEEEKARLLGIIETMTGR